MNRHGGWAFAATPRRRAARRGEAGAATAPRLDVITGSCRCHPLGRRVAGRSCAPGGLGRQRVSCDADDAALRIPGCHPPTGRRAYRAQPRNATAVAVSAPTCVSISPTDHPRRTGSVWGRDAIWPNDYGRSGVPAVRRRRSSGTRYTGGIDDSPATSVPLRLQGQASCRRTRSGPPFPRRYGRHNDEVLDHPSDAHAPQRTS